MKKITIPLSFLLSSILLIDTHNVYADNLTNLEDKKNTLLQEANASQEKKTNLEKQLHQVEIDIENLELKLAVLTKKIYSTNLDIKQKENLIQNTKQDIHDLSQTISQKERVLADKKAKLEENLKLMYSRGNVQFLEFLFRSDNLSQFLFRYEKYRDIMDKGEQLHNDILSELNSIKNQKGALEVKRLNIETQKQDLENKRNEQQAQQKQQHIIQHSLNQKRKLVKHEIDEEDDVMSELAKSISLTEQDIESEKIKIEEAKRKAEEEKRRQEELARANSKENQHNIEFNNSIPNAEGTILAPPMEPDTYTMTSPYGYRIHPITGVKKLHNGVDYAAAQNTPIYAMEEGYVLYAGKARGYGNWIVIKHPTNGLYTIYGHMYDDGLYVKPGDYVFRGQKIGGVGSAGGSTGNHLHFCVATSFNGSTFTYANPLNYIN